MNVNIRQFIEYIKRFYDLLFSCIPEFIIHWHGLGVKVTDLISAVMSCLSDRPAGAVCHRSQHCLLAAAVRALETDQLTF